MGYAVHALISHGLLFFLVHKERTNGTVSPEQFPLFINAFYRLLLSLLLSDGLFSADPVTPIFLGLDLTIPAICLFDYD